jgi:hypothetical protein
MFNYYRKHKGLAQRFLRHIGKTSTPEIKDIEPLEGTFVYRGKLGCLG